MKKRNCCGENVSCDVPVDLPEDYMDTLYAMYVKECTEAGKKPLPREDWMKSISA